MKRNYNEGESADVTFFVGTEVEQTPAYGVRTLFVTGYQSITEILGYAKKNNCHHIFFGANHSFDPEDPSEWQDWEALILKCLERDYLCSLDIPISQAEVFLEGPLIEFDNFIPQLRVPVPYIKQWNYNTMIKIDDRGFKETNPGVWCHSLHDLMGREKFTDWSKYSLDNIIK